ncbi:MAG: (2Fe-2S)-binding protein [Rhodopirellula sp.]|nr:(2Fe-2S)-binding protein [Rhodopirellula sp.]
MAPDDEVCLCFHVTKRKITNFIRVEKVRRAGQLADCYGAGTGCGWCRPYLQQIFAETVRGETAKHDDPSPEHYAELRQRYLDSG